jgi:hypothetical protein
LRGGAIGTAPPGSGGEQFSGARHQGGRFRLARLSRSSWWRSGAGRDPAGGGLRRGSIVREAPTLPAVPGNRKRHRDGWLTPAPLGASGFDGPATWRKAPPGLTSMTHSDTPVLVFEAVAARAGNNGHRPVRSVIAERATTSAAGQFLDAAKEPDRRPLVQLRQRPVHSALAQAISVIDRAGPARFYPLLAAAKRTGPARNAERIDAFAQRLLSLATAQTARPC